MTIDAYFETSERERNSFMDKVIIGRLPVEIQEDAKKRSTEIVANYVGRDISALSVLGYAAERGRFDKFATRLERHYRDQLKYIHPGARRMKIVPGAVRTEAFFLSCYNDLGIQPQKVA